MENSQTIEKPTSWLDKTVFSIFPNFKREHLIAVIILLIAIVSRFYNVGERDMDHDEVNHVVPSYELYMGNGYVHDPITHGPMQFHLVAATYFLFGDSDFASRVPSAVFGVMTVALVLFAFKRYLGRIGTLLAGLFVTISPYMLFYQRYTRNESFVAFFGILMIFLILRYLENGNKSLLFLFAAILSLQFCTKETAYIYTATALIFIAVLAYNDLQKKEWRKPLHKLSFSVATLSAFLFGAIALIAMIMESKASSTTSPFKSEFFQNLLPVYHTALLIGIGLFAAAAVLIVVFVVLGQGWNEIKKMRSFDLLILTITLILPLLTAFPVKLLGWDPLDYSTQGLIHTGIILVVMTIFAVVIGCLWNPSLWLTSAGIFYAIFTVLYTTFFTNGQGFFTGIVGSLGYWLVQQGVNRGTQPWYYYAFLQIPMYEYLPALGTILAAIYGATHKLFSTRTDASPFQQKITREEEPVEYETEIKDETETEIEVLPEESQWSETPAKLPVLALLVYWSVISLIAYSVAGEKMPWLTVHITMPMILAAGWGIGYLIESVPWKRMPGVKGYLAIPLLLIFVYSVAMAVGGLAGVIKPFSGTEISQLNVTLNFIFAVIGAAASAWGVSQLLKGWNFNNFAKLTMVVFFGVLAVLTARSAYQANFINYNNSKEFLVYAHGAAGPKEILAQVEEISKRTTGGKNIKVAYIGDALYPYWWYFRDYPNRTWLNDNINRDLVNYPLVISDDSNLSKVQSILGDNYYQFKYTRLWWPMMDYMNLTWDEVWNGIKNPQMVEAIFNIWFNKDYTLYAQVTNNQNLTLETWQPAASIYFFIRKDITSQIWEYGIPSTASPTVVTDPYQGKYSDLLADQFFGESGSSFGQLNTAHGIAIAPNGYIYIADSGNNRIEYFTKTGSYLGSWGSFGASTDNTTQAPSGTFNEPWGVAVGPDGSVYVADTWNNRIQKFSASGEFITMWGSGGLGNTPFEFYGPRGITVDANGRVYVTDTGNKRVVIFDQDGNYIAQIGSAGMDDGQFDEPVGLAVDSNGLVYVADTWNYRIQVFAPDVEGTSYNFLRSWTVDGWGSQSAQNKPFLALDASGNVYVTDPDNYRVIQYDILGNVVQVWGSYSTGIDGFGMPVGITADAEGHVWVVDAINNRVLRFVPNVSAAANTPVTSLPAFPKALVALNFNPATNQLMDALGQAYYTLDITRGIWVPIIPDAIAATLPEGANEVVDELGIWYIKDANGMEIYQWNQGALLWVVVTPEPTN